MDINRNGANAGIMSSTYKTHVPLDPESSSGSSGSHVFLFVPLWPPF
jgi:hypothetical protein